MLGGAPHSPTALMAALLRGILDTVTKSRGGPPDHVVLTHPAVWGAYRGSSSPPSRTWPACPGRRTRLAGRTTRAPTAPPC